MSWVVYLDLTGTFFFAVSGCLLAVRQHFDIIGSLLLGSLTGLGGGAVRDIILQVPVAAFDKPVYLVAPLAATVLVFFFDRRIERQSRALLIFDAGGLALFCTTGTLTASSAGINPVAAALLGVTTAVGGGLLRDIVANQAPALFDRHDLYALPAVLGASTTAALCSFDAFGRTAEALTIVFVFAIRILALQRRWRVPLATIRHREPEDR